MDCVKADMICGVTEDVCQNRGGIEGGHIVLTPNNWDVKKRRKEVLYNITFTILRKIQEFTVDASKSVHVNG